MMMDRLRHALLRYASPEMRLALRQLRQRVRSAPDHSPFPTRNISGVDRIEKGSALVLAPHPDDEVIGAGGALAQLLEDGAPATVLYLTDGRGPAATDLSLAHERRREAEGIAGAYGFDPIFWDVPDNGLTAGAETVRALVEVIRRLQPRLVFAPSLFDHQFDHFAANLLLRGALAEARQPGLTVLGYEVWDNMPFPNYLVDISGHFESKAAMLRRYRIPNEVTDFVRLCRSRAALHYLLYVNSVRREPEGYAEAYYRLDAGTYTETLDEYVEILRAARSPLLDRLGNGEGRRGS